MSKLSPARAAALAALVEAERSGRYVREVLAELDDCRDERDRGLALRLALGATASRGCLDELLDCFLAKPKKVSARVRWALRISAFEMLYLGEESRVAVSQGVELVRSQAKSAAGLANAVLRRVGEHAEAYLAGEFRELGPKSPDRRVLAAARACGIPVWLYERIETSCEVALDKDATGERSVNEPEEQRFVSSIEPAPTWIHSFTNEGFDGTVREFPGCYGQVAVASPECKRALAENRAVVSDKAAQLVACAATRAGSCLEIGAGRGTKTYMMLSHARACGLERSHVALELSEGKCKLNRERLEAAGFDARVIPGDALDITSALAAASMDPAASFDTVFVDAPCSGTGTMRRHPEIPWRLVPADVDADLPALQLAMLKQAAAHVAPAGELIYATCSVLTTEDEDVVSAFLASSEGASFELAPVCEAGLLARPEYEEARRFAVANALADGCFKTVSRSAADCDGHFCARFVKKAR